MMMIIIIIMMRMHDFLFHNNIKPYYKQEHPFARIYLILCCSYKTKRSLSVRTWYLSLSFRSWKPFKLDGRRPKRFFFFCKNIYWHCSATCICTSVLLSSRNLYEYSSWWSVIWQHHVRTAYNSSSNKVLHWANSRGKVRKYSEQPYKSKDCSKKSVKKKLQGTYVRTWNW